MWAAFAVAFISLATVGQSVNKGIMRLLGTLLGAVFSLTLVALFPDERWWFMLVPSTFVGLCTYLIGGSKRQYLWNVAGFVSVIICMESVAMAGETFYLAVLRTLETGLGILSYTLVTLLLWPSRTADELDAAVQRLVSTQRQLYHRYRQLLKDADEAEDTHTLRTSVVQQFSHMLSGARVDARLESLEAHEALIDFSRQVAAVDWPWLRAARF